VQTYALEEITQSLQQRKKAFTDTH